MKELDATIPHGSDLAPGMPGNTCAEEQREVRAKINEIIKWINENERFAK